MLDVDACEGRAHELISFTEGLDEAGMHDTARRSRVVARDVLDLVVELRSERSGRVAMQANYKRCLDVLANRAGEQLSRAVSEAGSG